MLPNDQPRYAAAYHPYTKNCCENYVTGILPLGNLVPVGAAESAGIGFFGSPDMPGSCNHRMGHLPMAEAPLANPRAVPGDGSCDSKGHCRLSDGVSDGREHRGAFLQYLKMVEAGNADEGAGSHHGEEDSAAPTTGAPSRGDGSEIGNATAGAGG